MIDSMGQYINSEKVITLLSDLIEIPSPYFQEEEAMAFIYKWLEKRGLPSEYHRYHEKKITNFHGVNVIGRIKGKGNGPKILLNGHVDTVQVCDGWTKDPFKAEVEGDRLYGLGALDMKSGVVAILLALEAFMNLVEDFCGEIIYTFVSDEEGPYGLGTDAVILDKKAFDADVAIVTEPSSGFCKIPFPCLCLGARGGWNYTLHIQGKSAHAANPELGINAISEAAKVLLALESTYLKKDEKLGTGSICILNMQGGEAACSVADYASFTVFRHVVMGEDRAYLEKEVREAIKKAQIQGTVEMCFREAPHPQNTGFEPYTIPESHPYTIGFQKSIQAITGKEGAISYFASIGDFNHLATRLKIPTYVFGPYGENYHAPDEYVSIHSTVKTAEVLFDYLVKMLKI
ncbi:MAG: M20/M25/M40 family metallo-hydrolase [Thermotaleaceae bacterium]